MLTVDDLFEYSLVINLDTAVDRMALLEKSFGEAGLPMPRRIGACHLRKLEYNKWWLSVPGGRYHRANVCASHLQCVHMAQSLGWPFVFILEDDAWPCRDARSVFEQELRKARPSGLWFPGWYNRSARQEHVAWFAGAHAYVVFADAYKALCDAYHADLPPWAVDKGVHWEADRVMFWHEPIYKTMQVSDRCMFTQMNLVDGKIPIYARLYQPDKGEKIPGMWGTFYRTVPEGFPTYEEIVNG